MKRGFLLMAVLAVSLLGARPGVVIGSPQIIQQPVEQQGNIINPTACVWDTDDSFSQLVSGRWEAGQTAVLQTCVVADHIAHRVRWVSDFGNGCYLTPEYDANEVDTLPAVGDGHGVIVPIVVELTNAARHPVKGAGRLQIRPAWEGCF